MVWFESGTKSPKYLHKFVLRILNKRKQKIFVIGLSKTATYSMAKALQILGYSTQHFPLHFLEYRSGQLFPKMDEIEYLKAFADTPITRFYKELDARFPGSKFILTVRDLDSWLNSCKKQFEPGCSSRWNNRKLDRLHADLYGAIEFEKEKFINAYNKNLKDVYYYFRNREEDLLVINICSGEGWDELCSFLNKQIPDVPFPHLNVSMKS